MDDSARHEVGRRADLLLMEERLDEYARFLSEAARRFPDDADIQIRAASALFDTSPEEAAECVRRAEEAAPSDPDQITRCGLMAFDLGDYRAAKEYAIRARDLDPEGDFALAPRLVHLGGKLALVAGHIERAEQGLRLAFEADPETVGHGRVLALFLAEEGRLAEARDVAAEALRHCPGNPVLVELQEHLDSEYDDSGE